MSRWLTPKASAGLLKVGDTLIPGTGDLPSFSASELIRDADRMLDYLSETDRKGLLGLAETLGSLPRWGVVSILRLAAHAQRFPDPVASILRQIDLGLKGFVYTLYYSDPAIRRRLGWETHIQTETPP